MTARKAYLAALVALLAALGTGLTDDVLTAAEWVGGFGSAVAAFAAVYFLPNARSDDPETSTPGPGDSGHADIAGLVVTAAVAVIVVTLYHLLTR